MSMPETLVLARHAWWWGNPYVRRLGRVRSPWPSPEDYTRGLTFWKGRRGANTLGGWILQNESGVDGIVSSPYKRSIQTATAVGRIAAPGLEVHVDERLKERSRGTDTGEPGNEPLDWQPVDGETLRAVGAKLVDAVRDYTAEHAPKTLLVVAHGEIITGARGQEELGNMSNEELMQGFPGGVSATHIANCAVDRYTSIDPLSGERADEYLWMRHQQTCGPDPIDTGWLPIQR